MDSGPLCEEPYNLTNKEKKNHSHYPIAGSS